MKEIYTEAICVYLDTHHGPGFLITDAWLREHGTAGMGWTAGQLRVLDIGWPPKHGWLRNLIGTKISAAQKGAFEAIGREHRQKGSR